MEEKPEWKPARRSIDEPPSKDVRQVDDLPACASTSARPCARDAAQCGSGRRWGLPPTVSSATASTLQRAAIAYTAIGIGSVAALAAGFPMGEAPLYVWALLPVLALLAEFLPVQLSARGLRMTFSLPFLAGTAAALGPLAAVLTDVAITLIAGYVHVYRAIGSHNRGGGYWIWANSGMAAISSSMASLAFFGLLAGAAGLRGAPTLAAIAFAAVYCMANFTLVAHLDALTAKSRLQSNLRDALQMAPIALLLYCLFAVAVTVLVYKGHYGLIALTLLPIAALRAAMLLKARLYGQYYETMSALTIMLQRAHPYTHGHLERVAQISEEVALRLGLPSQRAALVREAAVLHDIGKLAVDEEILDKPAKLTPIEFDHVKKHAAFGADILAHVEPFHEMVPWIRHHHERPDGTGYPDRLSNRQIPIESKIIAVVDAFDAMTGGEMGSERRPYREPMSQQAAIAELERCSGSQFDARVVAVFKDVVMAGAC
jgi:putative nucleotidyltransferase with HDIG domain